MGGFSDYFNSIMMQKPEWRNAFIRYEEIHSFLLLLAHMTVEANNAVQSPGPSRTASPTGVVANFPQSPSGTRLASLAFPSDVLQPGSATSAGGSANASSRSMQERRVNFAQVNSNNDDGEEDVKNNGNNNDDDNNNDVSPTYLSTTQHLLAGTNGSASPVAVPRREALRASMHKHVAANTVNSQMKREELFNAAGAEVAQQVTSVGAKSAAGLHPDAPGLKPATLDDIVAFVNKAREKERERRKKALLEVAEKEQQQQHNGNHARQSSDSDTAGNSPVMRSTQADQPQSSDRPQYHTLTLGESGRGGSLRRSDSDRGNSNNNNSQQPSPNDRSLARGSIPIPHRSLLGSRLSRNPGNNNAPFQQMSPLFGGMTPPASQFAPLALPDQNNNKQHQQQHISSRQSTSSAAGISPAFVGSPGSLLLCGAPESSESRDRRKDRRRSATNLGVMPTSSSSVSGGTGHQQQHQQHQQHLLASSSLTTAPRFVDSGLMVREDSFLSQPGNNNNNKDTPPINAAASPVPAKFAAVSPIVGSTFPLTPNVQGSPGLVPNVAGSNLSIAGSDEAVTKSTTNNNAPAAAAAAAATTTTNATAADVNYPPDITIGELTYETIFNICVDAILYDANRASQFAEQSQAELYRYFTEHRASWEGSADTDPTRAKTHIRFLHHELTLLAAFCEASKLCVIKLCREFVAATDELYCDAADESLLREEPDEELVAARLSASEDVVGASLREIETFFATQFAGGSLEAGKAAIASRVKPPSQAFRSGMLVALIIATLLYWLHVFLELGVTAKTRQQFDDALPIIRLCHVISLACVLYSGCLWVWEKYKINYLFLFEFSHIASVTWLQALETALLMMWLVLLLGVLFVRSEAVGNYYASSGGFSGASPVFIPLLFAVIVFLIAYPLRRVIRDRTRPAFFRVLWACMKMPFGPVNFVMFCVADIGTSLPLSLADLLYSFCYFGTFFAHIPSIKGAGTIPEMSSCTEVRRHYGNVIGMLPFYWRACQTLKMYLRTNNRVHLLNHFKYLSFLIYMPVAVAATFYPDSEPLAKALWFWHSFAELYAWIWDVLMDWGLVTWNRKRLFPPELHWVYPVIIVWDFIARFWFVLGIVYVEPIVGGGWLDLLAADVEILRRMIWAVFRLENENVNNLETYRSIHAVPKVALPPSDVVDY